jgi:hypothetical protein
MKIIWHTPYVDGANKRVPDPVWPDGWPLPRKGDCIELPEQPPLWVRGVDWYPHGSEEGSDPFVYIVLGTKAHP